MIYVSDTQYCVAVDIVLNCVCGQVKGPVKMDLLNSIIYLRWEQLFGVGRLPSVRNVASLDSSRVKLLI